MTKWQLIQAFLNRTPIIIREVHFRVINSIEHEDGSGRSFNVTGIMENVGETETVYIRTID